ncbi:MAG TPA: shikimate kinase [Jiangellaceae bacterium]|nr:shikimate kinase [Jiangellaceae bacterium]
MVTPRVVLVGVPGSGKTTVGRLLAKRLGVIFRDVDLDIEVIAGKPIGDIFVDDGERAFRDLERAAVAAALTGHDGVLAVGGGAVLDDGTRRLLVGHNVVFLDVGLADAAARIGLNRDRPVLFRNPRAELKRMIDERRPIYSTVATSSVDTAGRTPDEVVEAVLAVVG